MYAKRGRPRKTYSGKDSGTPELQHKREHNYTKEVLDLCLERNLINTTQHWCGLHLRWLHYLRFGSVHLQALNVCDLRGRKIHAHCPEWLEEREEEYREAIRQLSASKCNNIVTNIAIYNDGSSLFNYPLKKKETFTAYSHTELIKLQNGLNELATLWNMPGNTIA